MLQVRGLTKGYGGRTVLDGLDLDVAAGEVVALVGPNGVGKSTTLRCIVGSESPDAGEVRLGEALLDTRVPQTRRALCTVLGDLGVLPELTVAEHLDVLARGHGVAGGSSPAASRAVRSSAMRWAKTRPSSSELLARRLAPWTPVHEASPHA